MSNCDARAVFGAPYTFCAYGYPMQYQPVQEFPAIGEAAIVIDDSVAALPCSDFDIGGRVVRILDMEAAVAYHAKGNSFEVIQAMTMILRAGRRLDLDKMNSSARSLGTERHTGFLLDVCTSLFNIDLPTPVPSEQYEEEIVIPTTFRDIYSSSKLSLPKQTLEDFFGRPRQDSVAVVANRWRCVCPLSMDEFRKPTSVQAYVVPNFSPIFSLDLMFSDLTRVISFIAEQNVSYLISGGLAMAQLAHLRTSLDADIVLDQALNASSHRGLLEMAARDGLRVVVDDGVDLVLGRFEGSGLLHTIDICTKAIYERTVPVRMFAEAVSLSISVRGIDTLLRFMNLTDLVSLRLGTGRCRAIEDARSLNKMGLIDWPYLLNRISDEHRRQAQRDLWLASQLLPDTLASTDLG